MKYLSMMAMAAGVALATAAPANAALVIGYSVNGGSITQLATDAGTPGSVGYVGTPVGSSFSFNTGAFGPPATGLFDLLSQSINVRQTSGGPATLSIFITATDLASFANGSIISSFTSNTLTNATATISSYYNANNALYGVGGTLLRTAAFPAPGTFMGSNSPTIANPFSLTVRYDIAFGGGNSGNFNGTANLTAVPEPATWAMMMLGFGALGAMIRRRNTRTSARIRFA